MVVVVVVLVAVRVWVGRVAEGEAEGVGFIDGGVPWGDAVGFGGGEGVGLEGGRGLEG